MTTPAEWRRIIDAGPYRCDGCGVLMDYPGEHVARCPHEVVEVVIHPEEMYHLHGKAISGLRHSHPLRDGESRDEPDHEHEPVYDKDADRHNYGRAVYWRPQ